MDKGPDREYNTKSGMILFVPQNGSLSRQAAGKRIEGGKT
jgi:hypothetical protein